MRALIFDGKLRLSTNEPKPQPPAGEALIQVLMAGICNTDVEIVRGYFGFQGTLGHEFVGKVINAPDRPELNGRRVVGEINAFCGECATCRAGDESHCPNRTTLGIHKRNGAMADFVTLPSRLLHPISEALPDEVAVFTEPLAAALEITQRLHIRPTDRVVIIGDGKLGLLCAQVLQLTGCDLLVIGRHEEKLGILWQLGIRVQTADEPLPSGADIVVEATGDAEGFAAARRIVRPRGRIVMKSTYHGDLTINASMIAVDEVSLIGSRCGPFAAALRLLEQGLIDVEPMIDSTFPFDKALQAFDHAQSPGVLKVLLTMQ